MEGKLKISLFGRVRLENSRASIDEDMIHSRRILTLLAYLILHREGKVQNKTLYRQFIGEECKNPEATLKNLMYRLRGALKALGPEEYVCTVTGGYRWNPEIPVEVDFERFGELYGQISREEDPAKRKELCIRAAKCYNGNFSPDIAGEQWIVPWSVQAQARYLEIVEMLGELYGAEDAWEDLEELCRSALASEPYEEEIHSLLIRSLYQQKKFSQAAEHYENTRKAFYENFGVRDLEKLEEPFAGELLSQRVQADNLTGLQEEFREPGLPRGAFFCDSRTFRQIYRLEARRVGREGISEYLLLLTLKGQRGPLTAAGTELEGVMEKLEDVLRNALRIGDVTARVGRSQFVVLLSACTFEAGLMVANRIHREFKKKTGKQKLELTYDLGEIASPQKEGEKEAAGK